MRWFTEHGLLVVAVAGEDVQVHRKLEVRRRRPELLVVVRVKRQVRVRRLPDERTLEALLGATLEFLHSVVDVVHGDGRHSHQPVGRHRGVLHHPVVVGAERNFLQLGVVHGEVRQQVGGEEHLRAHPVGLHLGDALVRVRSARLGLKALPQLQLGKARHLVPVTLGSPFHEDVRRLHDVGVRRNNDFTARQCSVVCHLIVPLANVSQISRT